MYRVQIPPWTFQTMASGGRIITGRVTDRLQHLFSTHLGVLCISMVVWSGPGGMIYCALQVRSRAKPKWTPPVTGTLCSSIDPNPERSNIKGCQDWPISVIRDWPISDIVRDSLLRVQWLANHGWEWLCSSLPFCWAVSPVNLATGNLCCSTYRARNTKL